MLSERIKTILLCGWLAVSIPFLSYCDEIKGKVFNDTNKNLQLDPGEKGIPGVMVSNQKEVVLTDQEGNYTLPVDDATVVFVTKPSGYATPFDEHNLPKFYYIHQPQGSPNMRFQGISPTGNLPESVHFPLFESPETDAFEVIVYGDPQTASIEEIGMFRDDIASEVAAEGKAAFCFVLGDVAYDNLSLYAKINQAAACLGRPVYNVPGNHDLNHDVTDNRFAYDTFKKTYGPHYYSFDYGQVHFVALADIEWHPKQDNQKAYYAGMLGAKQLEWLQNDLRHVDNDRLLVVGMHIPFRTRTSDYVGDKVGDKEKFFEIIKDRRHVLLLSGHNHTIEHIFFDSADGWKSSTPLQQIICAAACGTWWGGLKDERGIPTTDQCDGTPNGYHILRIQGNKVEESFKPAFRSAGYQMRISTPQGKVAVNQLDNTKIIVNVFDGSEKFDVVCAVDALPAEKMQIVFAVDPYFVKLHRAHKSTYREWANPVSCTHLWQLPLPKELKPGLHKITVQAQNHYGGIFTACQFFEVE